MNERRRARLWTALAVTLPLTAADPAARLAQEPLAAPFEILGNPRVTAAAGAVLVESKTGPFACAALLVRRTPVAPVLAAARYRTLGADRARGELELERRSEELAPWGFERWDGCVRVGRGVREARLFLDIGRPGVAATRATAWVEARPGEWTWRPIFAPPPRLDRYADQTPALEREAPVEHRTTTGHQGGPSGVQ